MTDASDDTAAHIRQHYTESIGAVPPAIEAMLSYAPDAMAGFASVREYATRAAPDGALNAKTIELLFCVIDVVEGHEEGALAHAEEAVRAGLSVAELSQGLVIAALISGFHTWSVTGHKALQRASEVAADLALS